jgi:DASH complex subunit DAD2
VTRPRHVDPDCINNRNKITNSPRRRLPSPTGLSSTRGTSQQHHSLNNNRTHSPVVMSFPARSMPPRMPGASNSSSGGPSPALIARIEEKKAELQSLKQLRDMSAAVASQMEALEQQLSTLSDGTEGTLRLRPQLGRLKPLTRPLSSQQLPPSLATGIMCLVLSTWRQVSTCLYTGPLRSVGEIKSRAEPATSTAKLAKPNANTAPSAAAEQDPTAPPLPLTLVRIPTEHAPSLQAQAELAEQEADKRSP